MENNQKTRAEFAAQMMGLGEIYNRQITKSVADIYFSIFKDFTIDQFKCAVQAHVTNPDQGVFFPKPADILRHLPSEKNLSPEQLAVEAWENVIQALEKYGCYQKAYLGDKIAISCIFSIGGWKNLCQMSYEQLVWKRKDFLAAYETKAYKNPDHLPGKINGLEYSQQLDNKNIALDSAPALDSIRG